MTRTFNPTPHDTTPADIATMLALDRLDENRFRSRFNQPNAYSGIFGGQLLAHALAAADLTIVERAVHSMHAYFLRVGDPDRPLEFVVNRLRDGRRFSSRRVEAEQDGKLLFTMECSYRMPMEGLDHHIAAEHPVQPPPGVIDLLDVDPNQEEGLGSIRAWAGRHPIDIRIPSTVGFTEPAGEPRRHYWLRAPGAAAIDDPVAQRQIFAFMSDLLFSGVPLAMHAKALPGPHLFVASLDHSIWFHRPVRCDEWLLFETDCPSANGSVNLSRGLVYDRTGALVATLVQEALQTLF